MTTIKVGDFESYSVVHTGPPADRYTDHPLLGGIANWGCFHLVTTQNRPVMVDFDCRWLLSDDNSRFRPSVVDFGRYQPREGERRIGRRRKRGRSRGRRKTRSPVLLFARAIYCSWAISSPHAGRRNVSTREKDRGDYRLYRALCIGPSVDRYTDRPLPSGTAD
ncbi:hypothetical protein BHE74_00059474 [Ensete ventricosum]|nr:hypothetical protein BHE74_00059474 [Ensete ventricosum]